MSRHRAKPTIAERGQILVMSALVILVLVAAIGLAIDLGRIFVARAQLVRAVDAAALAGTLELPNATAAQAKVYAYMSENEPDAQVEVPISSVERQIEVNGSKTVPMFFMKVLGINSVKVTAHAKAGFGVLALDTVLTIDKTGSMGWDENGDDCTTQPGCPIQEAREAAKMFTDTLLSASVASSDTLVGVVPYNICYEPPWSCPYWWGCSPKDACTPASMVINLSNDKSLIESKIDNITADGSTNICLGLYKAAYGSSSVLWGPGHHTVTNTMRVVVLLSDGQNWWSKYSYDQSHGQPPQECRPSDPSDSDSHSGEEPWGSGCYNAGSNQRNLDTETYNLVNTIKQNNVEVWVVGFSVCGSPNSATCNTSMIGGNNHDKVANRNLLKCLASSTPGTNDHYFEAASASELPDIFEDIARLIGFRLIE